MIEKDTLISKVINLKFLKDVIKSDFVKLEGLRMYERKEKFTVTSILNKIFMDKDIFSNQTFTFINDVFYLKVNSIKNEDLASISKIFIDNQIPEWFHIEIYTGKEPDTYLLYNIVFYKEELMIYIKDKDKELFLDYYNKVKLK